MSIRTTLLRVGALAAAGLGMMLMTGCATTAPTASMQAAADDTDYVKVALINQEARRRGVGIYWYNYPQKQPGMVSAPVPRQDSMPAPQ